jgi:hypothetical protein
MTRAALPFLTDEISFVNLTTARMALTAHRRFLAGRIISGGNLPEQPTRLIAGRVRRPRGTMPADGMSTQATVGRAIHQETRMCFRRTRARGHYNCGDVVNSYGPKIFKKPTSTTAFVYYKTGTSDKLDDLRFDEKKVAAGIGKIKAMLNKGTPVRVYLSTMTVSSFQSPMIGDRNS